MRYSRLQWTHSSPAEPVEILSEHDEDGWELRKVEKFSDGSLRYASGSESGGAKLSLIPSPSDEEVVCEPEFRVSEISPPEFESAWKRARQSLLGVI